jgi:hypothetical protein
MTWILDTILRRSLNLNPFTRTSARLKPTPAITAWTQASIEVYKQGLPSQGLRGTENRQVYGSHETTLVLTPDAAMAVWIGGLRQGRLNVYYRVARRRVLTSLKGHRHAPRQQRRHLTADEG